ARETIVARIAAELRLIGQRYGLIATRESCRRLVWNDRQREATRAHTEVVEYRRLAARRTFEVHDDAQEATIRDGRVGAIRYCLRWAERRAVRAARHRNDERSITAHLRRPTDAAPFRARNAAVKNSGPRAAGRNTRQRAAGHVAV